MSDPIHFETFAPSKAPGRAAFGSRVVGDPGDPREATLEIEAQLREVVALAGDEPCFMLPRFTRDPDRDGRYRASFQLEALGTIDTSAVAEVLGRLPWLEWAPMVPEAIGGAAYVAHRGVVRRCVMPWVEPGSGWRVTRPRLREGQLNWGGNERLGADAPPTVDGERIVRALPSGYAPGALLVPIDVVVHRFDTDTSVQRARIEPRGSGAGLRQELHRVMYRLLEESELDGAVWLEGLNADHVGVAVQGAFASECDADDEFLAACLSRALRMPVMSGGDTRERPRGAPWMLKRRGQARRVLTEVDTGVWASTAPMHMNGTWTSVGARVHWKEAWEHEIPCIRVMEPDPTSERLVACDEPWATELREAVLAGLPAARPDMGESLPHRPLPFGERALPWPLLYEYRIMSASKGSPIMTLWYEDGAIRSTSERWHDYVSGWREVAVMRNGRAYSADPPPSGECDPEDAAVYLSVLGARIGNGYTYVEPKPRWTREDRAPGARGGAAPSA